MIRTASAYVRRLVLARVLGLSNVSCWFIDRTLPDKLITAAASKTADGVCVMSLACQKAEASYSCSTRSPSKQDMSNDLLTRTGEDGSTTLWLLQGEPSRSTRRHYPKMIGRSLDHHGSSYRPQRSSIDETIKTRYWSALGNPDDMGFDACSRS
jgi:hypothetical protein